MTADDGGRTRAGQVKLGTLSTVGAVVVFSAAALLPGRTKLAFSTYLTLMVAALLLSGSLWLFAHVVLRGRHSQGLFYVWTVLGVSVLCASIALTGRGQSDLYLLLALMLLFAASYYPPRALAFAGALAPGAYVITLAVTGWGAQPSVLIVRALTITLATWLFHLVSRERRRNGQESERRANLLATVAGAARDANILDSERLLEAVIDALPKLGAQWGHVSLFDDGTGTYRLVKGHGLADEDLDATPLGSADMADMVRRERATVVLGAEQGRDHVSPVLGTAAPTGAIGVPLWVDGALVGVLAAATHRPGGLRREDVEAIELLAGVASRALEGARRYQQVAESEARSRHQAQHDDLTGLANRALLNGRLHEALTSRLAGEKQVALLLLDLDDFKMVNDTLGHGAGDQLLVDISRRLESCVREKDTVARLSGDEFAVLVPGFDGGHLDTLIARLRDAVNEPSELLGHNLSVSASIGVAVTAVGQMAAGDAGPTASELLSSADLAMYEAKRAGKNCHAVFDKAMSERVKHRLSIEAALPKAIDDGEMTVFYQPIFELATRRVTGFEALLRWSNPQLGNVAPSEFIPIAEETGAIAQIGRWVMQQACWELQALRCENLAWSELTMSVNLSTRQLRDPDLVEDIFHTLQESHVPPAQLTLEITESTLLQDASSSQEKLAALGALGVQVALDDFGTGYSSLSYLQQLPVQCLKIDKTFVDGVDQDGMRTGPALIRSIAELADALGLETIAEGIETEQQLAALQQLGCRLGQGYVFSPAVAPAQAREVLREAGRAETKGRSAHGNGKAKLAASSSGKAKMATNGAAALRQSATGPAEKH